MNILQELDCIIDWGQLLEHGKHDGDDEGVNVNNEQVHDKIKEVTK